MDFLPPTAIAARTVCWGANLARRYHQSPPTPTKPMSGDVMATKDPRSPSCNTPHATRRRVVGGMAAVLGAAGGGGLLAACAGGTAARPGAATATPARRAENVSLQFWTSLTSPGSQGLLRPRVDRFAQQNPNIAGEMPPVAGSNNYEQFTSAIVGGTPPDAILTSGYPISVQWAANGQSQPMDQWSSKLGVKKEEYFPWVWEMQYHHGKLWCLVQEYDTNIFVWNKSLLEGGGVAPTRPPAQVAALDEAAQRLTRVEADKSIPQAGFIPWLGAGIVLWLAVH